MLRKFASLALMAAACAQAGHAQQAPALGIELNRSTATSDDVCQVVFVGRNGAPQDIEEVTLRLAVFDDAGIFRNMLSLPFGHLAGGTRRIVQFNLPTPCAAISEIVVDDVARCRIDGAEEDSDVCRDGLAVSSRSEIAFGL